MVSLPSTRTFPLPFPSRGTLLVHRSRSCSGCFPIAPSAIAGPESKSAAPTRNPRFGHRCSQRSLAPRIFRVGVPRSCSALVTASELSLGGGIPRSAPLTRWGTLQTLQTLPSGLAFKTFRPSPANPFKTLRTPCLTPIQGHLGPSPVRNLPTVDILVTLSCPSVNIFGKLRSGSWPFGTTEGFAPSARHKCLVLLASLAMVGSRTPLGAQVLRRFPRHHPWCLRDLHPLAEH